MSGPAGRGQVGQGAEGPVGEIVGGLGELVVIIGQAQLLQIVAAVGGGQEIGGHLRVEDKAAGGDALRQQGAAQGLHPVGSLFDVGGEQPLQKVVIAVQAVRPEDGGVALLRGQPALHAHHVQAGQGQHVHPLLGAPQGQQLLHPRPVRDRLAGAGTGQVCFLLRLALPLGGGEVVFVNELGKLQIQKQLIELRLVGLLAQVVLGFKRDGRVGVDGGQVIGHAGVPLALDELLPGGGLHVHLVQVGIQPVDGGLLGQQGHGRLLPDALHPGDVVRGVPHQGLQVDDVDGIEAIGLPKGLRGHVLGGGAAHAGGHQLYGGVVGDQLEGIFIPGDDDRVPPGALVRLGDGANQVVGLPAVQLVHGDVQGGEDLFQNGHLAGQLLGHGLALGLIALVGQVAEGGGLAVKGDAQGLGLLLVQQLVQNIQKAKHGVGGLARPGGQVRAHAVKGPVDDGVAVQDHQLVHVALPSARHPGR